MADKKIDVLIDIKASTKAIEDIERAVDKTVKAINEKSAFSINIGNTLDDFGKRVGTQISAAKSSLQTPLMQQYGKGQFLSGPGYKQLGEEAKRFKTILADLNETQIKTFTNAAIDRWGENLGRRLISTADKIQKAKEAVARANEWLRENGKIADKGMVEDITRYRNSQELVMHGMESGRMSIRNFALTWSLLKTEIKDTMFWQARWYASKFLIFEPMRLVGSALSTGFEFGKVIDEWEGKLLRWSATGKRSVDEVKANVKELIIELRKAAIDAPVTFEELAKAAESFIGAGIPEQVVKSIVPQLAQLRTAFPEINAEQFGVAITGVYNAMKDSMKGTANEGQKIVEIIEKMLRAQAKGVIRPEQFVQVTQHLGEMSRLAGFSIDQMLALSVLVTDLGSRAGSAARSLRGMIETLVKKIPGEKLKLLGIDIKGDMTLADQFVDILRKLRTALGEPGAKSKSALSALTSIFGPERIKSISAATDFLEKYLILVGDIQTAEGGLAASAKDVAGTVASQLKIMNNRWRELSGSIFTSNGVMRDMVAMINDTLLGALLAVGDAAVMAKHNIEELGPAGKLAYGTMEFLSGAFTAVKGAIVGLWGLLSPLVEGLRALIDMVVGTGQSLKFLGNVITTVLLVAFASKITGVLAATHAFRTFLGILGSLPAMLTSLSFALKVFWSTNLPVLLAILAISGIVSLVENYNKKQRAGLAEAQETSAKYAENVGKLGLPEAQAMEAAQDAEVNALNEKIKGMEEYNKLLRENKSLSNFQVQKETYSDEYISSQKKILETKKADLAQTRIRIDSLKSLDEAKKNALKNVPELKTPKARFSGELSDIKREYDEQIKVVKDKEKEKLGIVQDFVTLGVYSKSKAAELEVEIIKESNTKEIELENKKWLDIEEAYQRNRPKGKDDEQKKAIDADYRNAWLEHSRKIVEINIQTQNAIRKAQVTTIQDMTEMVDSYNKFVADSTKTASDRRLGIIQSSLEREKQVREFLYGKKQYDPKKYYDEELDALEQVKDARLESAKVTWESYQKANELIKKQADLYSENSPLRLKVYADWSRAENQYFEESRKAWDEYSSKLIEINQKMYDDIQYIYKKFGASGVMGKAAEEMSAQFGDVAGNIKSSFETSINGINDSFEALFEDIMEGGKNMEKILIDLLKKITMEIIKTTAIKPVMAGMTDWLKNMFMPKEQQLANWQPADMKNYMGIGAREEAAWSPLNTQLPMTATYLEALNVALLEAAAAARAFAASAGGGGGGSNILSGLFSGGGGSDWYYASPSEIGYAAGGRPKLNRVALVGEKGPELFVPDTSGTIIPNHQLGGGGNNTTVNVINQTSKPVEAKQGEVKFDGDKYIVNVVLKELTQNYGPLRHAVGGVRGR